MKFAWPLCLASALMIVAACGTPSDPDGSDEITETSLSADVMPLIQAQCGGCHMRTNPPFPDAVVNSVFLETEADILGLVGSFITSGDSANSGFVSILTQDMAVGATPTLMPPPGMADPMSDDDIAVISAWIDEGAKDN